MALSATAEERFDLITRRLQEVLGGDLIKAILAEGRPLKGYWGAFIHHLSFLHVDSIKYKFYRNCTDGTTWV
jgi:tyrosyl-tRNA synthetase